MLSLVEVSEHEQLDSEHEQDELSEHEQLLRLLRLVELWLELMACVLEQLEDSLHEQELLDSEQLQLDEALHEHDDSEDSEHEHELEELREEQLHELELLDDSSPTALMHAQVAAPAVCAVHT